VVVMCDQREEYVCVCVFRLVCVCMSVLRCVGCVLECMLVCGLERTKEYVYVNLIVRVHVFQ
jgi:hypothetical protein